MYVRKGEESVGVCEEGRGGEWVYVHMYVGAGRRVCVCEEGQGVEWLYVRRGRGGQCGCM